MTAAILTLLTFAAQPVADPTFVGPPAPPGVDWLTGLLDRGPLGLAVILMVALVWLFRFYERKLETQRSEFRTDYDQIRDDNRALLVRATEVVGENNTLLARVVPILERGER